MNENLDRLPNSILKQKLDVGCKSSVVQALFPKAEITLSLF